MTDRVVAIIQARMNSTRLPGKAMLPLAGLPVLAHVIARTRRIEGINAICVAIPESGGQQTIVDFVEKPIWKSKINAGIYVINAELKNLIDKEEQISMPSFLKRIMSRGHKINIFPLHEEWIDIGNPEEFKKVKKL